MSAPTLGARLAIAWVDHTGVVHERRPGRRHETYCELSAGVSNKAPSPRACRDCIRARLDED